MNFRSIWYSITQHLYMRSTLNGIPDSASAIYLINVLEIFNKSGSVNTTQNNLFYDSRHFH